MAMQVSDLTSGGKLYTTARGAMSVHHLGEGGTLHTTVGTCGEELATVAIEDGEAIFREHGRCVFCVDGYDSKQVTTEFREKMTEWFKGKKGKPFKVHLLVKSSLLKMAAQLLNLLSGMTYIHIYSDIGAWERACRADVSTFRRRPMDASSLSLDAAL